MIILVSCLLLAATAFGQRFSPKRIVYNNDSLICFTYKQELDLLVKIKQCNAIELELADTRLLWNNCNTQLQVERNHYKDLNKLYTELETEADSLRTKYKNEVTSHAGTKALLQTETNRKRNWRMAAIAEGIIIVAIFLVK